MRFSFLFPVSTTLVVGGLGLIYQNRADLSSGWYTIGCICLVAGAFGLIAGAVLFTQESKGAKYLEREAWKKEDAEFSSAVKALTAQLTYGYEHFLKTRKPANPPATWSDAASRGGWPKGIPLVARRPLREWDESNGDPLLLELARHFYPPNVDEPFTGFDEKRRGVKRRYFDIWGDRYKHSAAFRTFADAEIRDHYRDVMIMVAYLEIVLAKRSNRSPVGPDEEGLWYLGNRWLRMPQAK